VLTFNKLTADQKGWAEFRYPGHTKLEGKWVIADDKPGVPCPVPSITIDRSRGYETDCECEQPDYEHWGTRVDGVELYQCENCGEVVVEDEEEE
jgi:hypothetical protein